MNYTNGNIFADMRLDADARRNDLKPVVNPKTRYMKIDRDDSRASASKAPAEEKRKSQPSKPAVSTPAVMKPQNSRNVQWTGKDEEFKLDMTNQGLLNALILSEALGRPKCFRTGRRPLGR